MYVVRTLIFLVLMSDVSLAQVKSVSLSASSSDYVPKSSAMTIEEKLRNNIKDITLNINQIKISDNWKSTVTLSSNTADYSQYRIYDTNGTNFVPLAGKLTEHTVLLDQVMNLGPHIFEIITASNFGTTPLRKSNISVAYLRKLNALNTIGLVLSTQKQNLPVNYFQNPNNGGNPETRPTELDTNSFEINFEHIFTSRYKNRIELSAGQRIQDRPLRYGINLKNIYVLNDTMALRGDFGYVAESTSQKLKNDLGYQTSYWFESKLIHSVNSYVNYGIGYAVEINKEYRKWSDTTEQLGNDQILADIKYEASAWSINFSVAYAKYNTAQTGTNLKVGLEWEL